MVNIESEMHVEKLYKVAQIRLFGNGHIEKNNLLKKSGLSDAIYHRYSVKLSALVSKLVINVDHMLSIHMHDKPYARLHQDAKKEISVLSEHERFDSPISKLFYFLIINRIDDLNEYFKELISPFDLNVNRALIFPMSRPADMPLPVFALINNRLSQKNLKQGKLVKRKKRTIRVTENSLLTNYALSILQRNSLLEI